MSDAQRGPGGPTRAEFDALKAQVNEQGAEINDLNARVTELEGGAPVPPSKDPSPDGTTVTDTSGAIVDGFGRTFRLVGAAGDYKIDIDGTVSGAGVVQLYAKDATCYQENYQGWWWYMPADQWVQTESPTGEGPTPPDPQPGLTFFDEFDGLTLWNRDRPDDSLPWRPTRWYSPDEWDGWNCNNGRMLNPYKQPGAAVLYGVDGSGNLFLAMDRADPKYGDTGGRGYVTSQINQLSFKQHGGYWECRRKAPRIRGTNTAFWLMNMNSWPPEVDIIEMVQFTDGSSCMAQNLWSVDQTTNPYYDFGAVPDAWHTYGFWWDTANGQMHYFFDGAHTHQAAQPSGYDAPMFAICSMQQGGDWSGPVPDGEPMGRALFDYVRISENPPGALLSAPQAQPSARASARGASPGLGASVAFERSARAGPPRRR